MGFVGSHRTIALFVIAALGSAAAADAQRRPAPTTLRKRVVTPSGDAEMLFSFSGPETRARLAGACQKLGWAPRLSGPANVLHCDVSSNEKTFVNTRGIANGNIIALVGTGFPLPIRKEVVFYLKPMRGGTLARAQGARLYPAVNSPTLDRRVMGDENTFNGLINVMALVGGRFAPGTRFDRVGYLGFRSDQVRAVPTADGKERTSLIVGDVDAQSPAALAAILPGDVIHTINGQTFGDYQDAARIMAGLRPGKPVRLTLERDGSPRTVDLVATNAPVQR